MRPDPEANLQILKAAYAYDNILQVAPSDLRQSRDEVTSPETRLAVAPEWAAQMQAMERSKIFVVVCHGFAQAWLASRHAAILPTPPKTVDAAYR